MGVDLSELCQLLQELAARAERWQKMGDHAALRAPINQIRSSETEFADGDIGSVNMLSSSWCEKHFITGR